jgi:hypothetical protein
MHCGKEAPSHAVLVGVTVVHDFEAKNFSRVAVSIWRLGSFLL